MTMQTFRSRTASMVLAGALVATIASYSSDARSEPSAAEHAKRAQAAYDVQNWAAAIQEFQAAYQADQKPDYLWGLAQTQRLSGDCASAIKTYKAYKRNDGVTGTQSTAAELQITKCEAEIEKKEAEATAARNKAAAAEPAPASPSNAPSSSSSSASSSPAQRNKADKADDGPTPFYTDVFGDVLLAAGVGVGVVGGFFLLKGNSDMSSSSSTPFYRDYDVAVDSASDKQTLGAILLAGGGVLVGCAVLRYVLRSNGKPTTAEHTGLVVGPTGVFGRF